MYTIIHFLKALYIIINAKKIVMDNVETPQNFEIEIITHKAVTFPAIVLNISNTLCQTQGIMDDVPGICVVIPNNNIPLYVCNREFLSLRDSLRIALIEHEIAHVVLGHVKHDEFELKRIFLKAISPFCSYEIEREADLLAASKVGTLEYTYTLAHLNACYVEKGYSGREILRRVIALTREDLKLF